MSTTVEVSVLELASAMPSARQLLRMRQQIALLSLFHFPYDRLTSQPAVSTTHNPVIHPLDREATEMKKSNQVRMDLHSAQVHCQQRRARSR